MSGARKPKNRINQDGSLTCRVCGRPKPLREFYRNRANSTGYDRVCKPCARAKAEAWRAKNKQRRSAPDPELRAAQRVKRDHAEKAAESNLVPGWRRALFVYYGGKCLKCGSRRKLQADHVVALAAGGDHRIENFQVLCQRCNLSKHSGCDDYRRGDIFTEVKMRAAIKALRNK